MAVGPANSALLFTLDRLLLESERYESKGALMVHLQVGKDLRIIFFVQHTEFYHSRNRNIMPNNPESLKALQDNANMLGTMLVSVCTRIDNQMQSMWYGQILL